MDTACIPCTQRASAETPPTATVTLSRVTSHPLFFTLHPPVLHPHCVSPRPARSKWHAELCWLLGLPPPAISGLCPPLPLQVPTPLLPSPWMALLTITGCVCNTFTCMWFGCVWTSPTVPKRMAHNTRPHTTLHLARPPCSPTRRGRNRQMDTCTVNLLKTRDRKEEQERRKGQDWGGGGREGEREERRGGGGKGKGGGAGSSGEEGEGGEGRR